MNSLSLSRSHAEKMGANSYAGFTAETLVTPLCNSMHVAAELVRSKHIPVMPKQALLTAAHFSCALKFNSVPTNPCSSSTPSPYYCPLPPPNRSSLLTSVISNKSHLIICLLCSAFFTQLVRFWRKYSRVDHQCLATLTSWIL